MTRCKKSKAVFTYNKDKYWVVWYKMTNPKITVYYNGHSQDEWGQKWEFLVEKNNSLTYLIKENGTNQSEFLRESVERPPHISQIAERGFNNIKNDESHAIFALDATLVGIDS